MTSPFLKQVQDELRSKHYSIRTAETYLYWIKSVICDHKMRHPKDMHCADVREFLNDLALTRHVATSTQKTALKCRVFVYRRVLDNE